MIAEQVVSRTIEATVGELFTVMIWEDRTAGYSWDPRYDPTAFDLVDDDYERTVQVDTADYGRRTFTFLAKMPGQHSLVLEHLVGWKTSAANRRQYTVHIRPTDKPPASHSVN